MPFRREMEARGIRIVIARASSSLIDVLERADVLDRLGEQYLFPTVRQAVETYLDRHGEPEAGAPDASEASGG